MLFSEMMPTLMTTFAILIHLTANTSGRLTKTLSNQKQKIIKNNDRVFQCTICRYRRTGVLIDIATLYGYKAQKILLKDAKKVFSLGPDRVFHKKGGYARALKEFYEVKPNEVDEYHDNLIGMIGDRQIIMERGQIGGSPRIYLITWGPEELYGKNAKRFMDTIIYKYD